VTSHESEELLLMILDSGQEYRSIGEWRRLCEVSQARAEEARAKASRRRARRRGAWQGALAVITVCALAYAVWLGLELL
jgi:ferric-dicitrate binding protein FerR (iron transport regulator)